MKLSSKEFQNNKLEVDKNSSSFLFRIKDLYMFMDNSLLNAQSHRGLNVNNLQRDLFSIYDRSNVHVVLDALVKRALSCAMDEGTRWSPDKFTDNFFSKFSSDEQKF